MSLEKRIKRHIIGRRHDFFAVTLPGFERLCADELSPLSNTIQISAVTKGGVSFSGRLTDLYQASLHTSTAGRILMRLAEFKASNFPQLETHACKIMWELYLPPGVIPQVNVTARHSRLYHTDAVADHIRQSIAACWSSQNVPPCPSAGPAVFARLQDDRVTLSLDSSGQPLHLRGLKTHAARAPLRETMAAAILKLAGYRPDGTLIDPMCGAGTFSLEAALTAKRIPAGRYRRFAFMEWPGYRSRQWDHLLKSADGRIRSLKKPTIWASDSDRGACDRLEACLRQNSLDDAVDVSRKDFFSLQPGKITHGPGLIVLNPPYGQRLGAAEDTRKLYRDIAAKLKKDFKGWKAALMVPRKKMAQQLDLPLKPLPIQHGGLKVVLLVGVI